MELRCFGSSSRGNCYALISDEILIIDAGIKYQKILSGIDYRIADVAGVLISHEHKDHSMSADDFKPFGIPVFKPYEGGEQSARFGNFQIKAFPLPHDGVENRGFLIQHPDMGRLLYMTDMEYCKFTFSKQKVNHMIVEADYDKDFISDDQANREHVLRGHAEINTTVGIVEANKTDSLKTVLLAHLSGSSADPDDFIERVQKVAGNGVYVDYARAGLNIELEGGDKV